MKKCIFHKSKITVPKEPQFYALFERKLNNIFPPVTSIKTKSQIVGSLIPLAEIRQLMSELSARALGCGELLIQPGP